MPRKLKSLDIEIAVAEYFDPRRNLVIPNVSYGFRHRQSEKDLMIVTPADHAYEVEIKVSKSDLIRDKKKRKWKLSLYFNDFRKIFFAIPTHLMEHAQHIPDFAGIIVVEFDKRHYVDYSTFLKRKAKINKNAKKITEKERYQLARLGALRLWNLKRKILITQSK